MTPPRDPGSPSTVDVVIPSDPAEARRVQDEIERLLRLHDASEQDIFSIRLALEEALVNAIKHGNQMDRSKKVTIVSVVQPSASRSTSPTRAPASTPATCPTPPPSRTSNGPAAAASCSCATT